MRKFFWIFLIFAVCFTGCHKTQKAETEEAVPVANDIDVNVLDAPETMPDIQTVPETEAETVPFSERVSALKEPEMHILDECGVLPEDAFQQYNDYLERIASSGNVNVFLVITDHLDGNSPEQFAEKAYHSAGEASCPDGILFLLNNDTNQDCIFTAGSCKNYISQSEIDTVLSGASYDLINKNYTGALNQILTLCENIPV